MVFRIKIKLLLLTILLLSQSFILVAQNKKVVVGLKHGSTYFYENYPNSIEVGFQGFCENDFSIELICEECDSIKSSEKYSHTIYASKSRSVRLAFLATSKQTNNTEFISANSFNVIPLPSPSVMFGHFFSNQNIDLKEHRTRMFNASYPPSTKTHPKAVFGIKSWRVRIGKEIFEGTNSKFSKDLTNYSFYENKAKNMNVEVCLTISAPDDTERVICDTFKSFCFSPPCNSLDINK